MDKLTQAQRDLLCRALCVYRQELWRELDREEYRQVNELMTALTNPPKVNGHEQA